MLINNLGRFSGGPASPLAVIGVTSGLKYRFRLVNISCRTFFTISLDGHNFTVIEADGIEHEPLVVDSLTIFVGQRYSIIVDASAAIDNYWFRAVPGPSIVNQASSSKPIIKLSLINRGLLLFLQPTLVLTMPSSDTLAPLLLSPLRPQRPARTPSSRPTWPLLSTPEHPVDLPPRT